MSSINPVVQVAQQVLLGGAVKQNHALEHATIVLLSRRFPDVRLAGISFAAGFFVFGDVPTETILPAATEALKLLRTTSPELAIHERCGTNLAVSGMLTGLAAMAVAKMRRPFSSLNNVILASTAALILARPLGLTVQRYVTTQTPNDTMTITGVKPYTFFGTPAHFVSTDNPEAMNLFA
jgi:nitrogen fixation protein